MPRDALAATDGVTAVTQADTGPASTWHALSAGEVTERLEVEVPRGLSSAEAARRLDVISRDARMLVVGSRGLGGSTGMVLGSVSDQCVRHASCPVLVVCTRN